jgi:hypothetical protein
MKHVLYLSIATMWITLSQGSICTTKWDQWLKRFVTECDKPKQTCITTYDQWLKEWKTACKERL